MAVKLDDKIDPARLYDEDFYAWAKQQADILRACEATRPNLPLDFAHLIDEVEDLGESLVRATKSQLRRLIQHLLKLEYSPADRPRQQWLKSVDQARLEIDDVLTASVRNAITPLLGKLFENARDLAKRDLLSYGEPNAARALPETCPYTLDQLTDKAWYPANRHGLVDPEL